MTIEKKVRPYYLKLEAYKFMDVLIHVSCKETVLDALVTCQRRYKIRIHAWVVLSSSLRMVISCDRSDIMIENVVDAFMDMTDKKLMQHISRLRNETKRATLLKAFESNNAHISFWYQKYKLDLINTPQKLEEALTDIHESPVRNAFVWDAEHYMYSSAIDYSGEHEGLLTIDQISSKDILY